MSGQAVTLSGGQSFTAFGADTITAPAGTELVNFDAAGGVLIDLAGSDVQTYSALFGYTVEQAASASTLQVVSSNATIFVDGAAAETSGALGANIGAVDFTNSAGGSLTIQGGGVAAWANSTNLLFIGATSFSSNDFAHAYGSYSVDAGSSNSTVVAGAGSSSGSNAFAQSYPSALLFVGRGGVLNIQGSSSSVTAVATAGANTVNGAAATGSNVFVASSGNSSLVGGAGNDWFVVGTGSASIDASSALSGLVVVNGAAGGSDVLSGWTSADAIYAFGYGASGVAGEQVVGGSLRLTLTDNTQITLAGVSSIGSAQLHIS